MALDDKLSIGKALGVVFVVRIVDSNRAPWTGHVLYEMVEIHPMTYLQVLLLISPTDLRFRLEPPQVQFCYHRAATGKITELIRLTS